MKQTLSSIVIFIMYTEMLKICLKVRFSLLKCLILQYILLLNYCPALNRYCSKISLLIFVDTLQTHWPWSIKITEVINALLDVLYVSQVLFHSFCVRYTEYSSPCLNLCMRSFWPQRSHSLSSPKEPTSVMWERWMSVTSAVNSHLVTEQIPYIVSTVTGKQKYLFVWVCTWNHLYVR